MKDKATQRSDRLNKINAAYALLRRDAPMWATMEQERKEWDVTLADGLPADEEWTDDGRVRHPRSRQVHP